MKGEGGFTFIELAVVLGIIGTLLAMATLYFVRLNEKYQIESLTKELYSSLMRARNNAATSKVQWVVNVDDPHTMRYGLDANRDGVIDAASPPFIKSPRFALQARANIPDVIANNIVFDRLGLLANQDAQGHAPVITLNIAGFSANANAAMDCVAIAATRINIGKMNAEGSNCDQR